MTCRVQILPDSLINKIAAGEVVERPASVVKELAENSIDAGASRVSVEIEQGGRKLIKVSDDGTGMSLQEAKLAVSRHATSKIASVEDLFSISSFGFRGEALPSIASVSIFSMITRQSNDKEGARVVIEGGEMRSGGPVGAPPGTTIEVRELFFNLPARRKFMKSVTTEMRQVSNSITALAISHPAVGFRLKSDGRQIFDVAPTTSLAGRVSDVYGENLFERMVSVDHDAGPLKVIGFVTIPDDAKRHRMETRFYVNRRPISSRLLHAAVMSAYGELLPKGCYPQGAIFLDISTDLVDVNVSPTKSDVRFKDERSVYHIIYHSVSEAVRSLGVIPEAVSNSESSPETADYLRRTRAAIDDFAASHVSSGQHLQVSMPIPVEPKVSTHDSNRAQSASGVSPSRRSSIDESPARRDDRDGRLSHPTPRPYRILGFADLYILALSTDTIFVIDQHAAHERVLYEKALTAFDSSQVVAQKLLFPVNVELDVVNFGLAEELTPLLGQLGFEVTPFGKSSVAIYASPAVSRGKNPEQLLRNILDDMSGESGGAEEINKKMAQSFACRAAIKAGDRLSEEEMKGLIEDLFACVNPYVCSHGRPTLLRLSMSDLEKRFGR
jgi:DNA mismatch repair protein MutL